MGPFCFHLDLLSGTTWQPWHRTMTHSIRPPTTFVSLLLFLLLPPSSLSIGVSLSPPASTPTLQNAEEKEEGGGKKSSTPPHSLPPPQKERRRFAEEERKKERKKVQLCCVYPREIRNPNKVRATTSFLSPFPTFSPPALKEKK